MWSRVLALVAILVVAGAATYVTSGADLLKGDVKQQRLANTPDVTISSTLPVEVPKAKRLTVSVSGDVLIHSPLWQQAEANGKGEYDFAPMFAQIKPRIRAADLALCHMETPLTRGEPASYPIFATPAALTKAIDSTGWDACSTASNHAVDGGLDGIAESTAILDDAGIEHTGTYASKKASVRPLIIDVDGVEVAWLSYTDATNGLPVPEPWAVGIAELGDPSNVIEDAREARRLGADAVLVNLHWGAEYASAPAAEQVTYAGELTDSDAITAVVGQGPHVVQPIEWMHDKPIIFSEGNLVSNQTPGCCDEASQDGLIAELELVAEQVPGVEGGYEVTVKKVRYLPIWVRHPDYTVVPAGVAVREGAADIAALRDSYERTVATVGQDGRTVAVPAKLR